MHAAPYGTRLRQARSESELRRTGLGALLGGPGALPQAFGAVENARVRVWLCGKCQTGRRTRGLCIRARYEKAESSVSDGSTIKILGFRASAIR